HTLCLLEKICIFKLFQELRVWVHCCSCRAHTNWNKACGIPDDLEVKLGCLNTAKSLIWF
ncbi:hypothetical protein, partial [Plebeiibacterium marinum]